MKKMEPSQFHLPGPAGWCPFCFVMQHEMKCEKYPASRSEKKEQAMSGRIADCEKGSSSPAELIDSLSELRRQIRERDLRIRNLESLLDRILICINAFGNGEGAYSLSTLVQAIVQEIAICRLMAEDTDIPDA